MVTVSAEAPSRSRRPTVPDRDAEPVKGARTGPVCLGQLLAVCGLTGGAGATTLAYLVARAAAQTSSEPVLVADTGGPSGGLAGFVGVEVPFSLGELAGQLAVGAPLGGPPYATTSDGLRVLASGSEFSTGCAHEQVIRLIADAREAHALTVIDCGTLARAAEQIAAAAATHVAWVLPATARGVSRGRRVLDAAPRVSAKELVVARRDERHPNGSLRELRRIAAERSAPLVLVPHLPGLDAGKLNAAAEAAQVPVQAILGALQR